jgi:hypothetical protein
MLRIEHWVCLGLDVCAEGFVHCSQIHSTRCVNFEYFRRWWIGVRSPGNLVPPVTNGESGGTGLIYRQHKPVYYSPSSRSALAEAELVYQDNHISHSAYVCFELDTRRTLKPTVESLIKHHKKVRLLIWTTTPWTLSANMVRTMDTVLGSCSRMFRVSRSIRAQRTVSLSPRTCPV